jgi:mRNA interferase YafQ
MLTPFRTTQFKRDVKLAEKRGRNMAKLKRAMIKLIQEEELEPSYRDHKLGGEYKSHRECHIEPDWLLIYQLTAKEIHFTRTGTHADLFGK